MRGYYGVAVYQPKNKVNIGTLWRTAYLLGADYLATIGRRYNQQASDTYKATRHMPLFHFESFADFKKHLPEQCRLVAVELDDDASLLDNFVHPEQACYLLGSEDNGLPREVLEKCDMKVKLRGDRSMNVATAGSIVIYHRGLK